MLPDDSSPRIPSDPDRPGMERQDREPSLSEAEGAEGRGPASERPPAPLRCPVCRARQPLQPVCRRCKADLRLLVAALGEVHRLEVRHEQVLAQGDRHAADRIAHQLRQLRGRE